MGSNFEKDADVEHAILSACSQGLEYLHSASAASQAASFGHLPLVSVITTAGSRDRLARDEANILRDMLTCWTCSDAAIWGVFALFAVSKNPKSTSTLIRLRHLGAPSRFEVYRQPIID